MDSTSQLQATPEGVIFEVVVDSERRACLITSEALKKISELGTAEGADAPDIKIFTAYEARISGIARRLAAAGVPGKPLRVEVASIINHMPPVQL